MIADLITVSRMLFSLLLLGFPTSSGIFAALYLLCGITDVLDGFAARRLHSESEKGAILDSAADLLFALIYAVKILPLLQLPRWVWIWTAAIAVVKITGILLRSGKAHGLFISHSFANKLTGLLIFLLPLTVRLIDIKYGAAAVCTVASFAAAVEVFELKGTRIK